MNPIYLLFISLFALILYVNETIVAEKISKFKLMIATLNVLVSLLLVLLYEDYILNTEYDLYYTIYTFVNIFIFIILMYKSFKTSAQKSALYQLFLSTIAHCRTDIYLVISETDKIVDISDSLLQEFGLSRQEVIRKNIYDVINKSIRVIKLNEQDMNNEYYKAFYRRYRETIEQSKGSETRELQIANYQGDNIMINGVESPIFVGGRYRGRLLVGEKMTDTALLEVEKKLNNIKQSAESLRQKFVATLELIEDSVYYYDQDEGYIWVSDNMKELLKLETNTLRYEEFKKYIYKDDLTTYLDVVEKCQTSQKYRVTYRFQVKHKFVWVEEIAKKVEEGKVILGTMKIIEKNKYQLDKEIVQLPTEDELFEDVNQLVKLGKRFGILRINLTNIIDINNHHGRQLGDLMIKEYVIRVKNSFIKGGIEMYRVGGIDFALLIKDMTQFDVVTKSLYSSSGSRLMNLSVDFGAVTETLIPSIGISSAPDDSTTTEGIIIAAEKALNMAKKKTFKNNYCFYQEIQDLDEVAPKKKSQISLDLMGMSKENK